MRTAGPNHFSQPAQGFYMVHAQPQHQVSTVNWRLVSGVALLVAVTNLFTFFYSEQPESQEFIREVKRESLYLIEKAAHHISDVNTFAYKVRQVSLDLDVPPEWLMAVMYAESKFDPAIQNLRGSGATGLIQFMVPAVQDLNDRLGTKYYMSDIRRMPAHDQLDLVYEYLQTVRERYGEYRSLTDLYLGILYPKAIGQDFCYALYVRGSRAYRQNRGLDENKDGIVTVSDIDQRLKRIFPQAYMVSK